MEKNMLSYNIFLIEDNLGDITLINAYIEEQFTSAHITVARNYKESLSILTDTFTSFDIILLDLSLPDKSGAPLISDIMAHPQIKCPVIVLTGYADIEFSIKSIALGISDYLLKDELTAAMLYKSIIYGIERCDFKVRLQESENKFSLFFNLSPQPMWVYDIATLQFTDVNEAALINYGYTKKEFFNIDPTQLHPPEEREDFKKALTYIDNKKLSFSGSFKHCKKNGEEIEVEIYSTLLVIDAVACRSVIAVDVTAKNMAEIKLTQAIIKTQEEERYAIGGELHDNICQILAGSMLNLSIIKLSLAEDKVAILSQGIDNIRLATTEIRNLSHRLAPAFFDDMKLKDSLLHLLSSVNPEGKFETALAFDKELENISLKRDLQLNFYRIAQEQLNNIQKYANASTIQLSFSINAGNIKFEISDNGIGFDKEKIFQRNRVC